MNTEEFDNEEEIDDHDEFDTDEEIDHDDEFDNETEDTYDPREPEISVVIPVLDEEHRINDIIQHLRDLDGGKHCQIIVIDGDPDGETIDEIEDMKVVTAIGEAGRAKQMNAGAQLALGDVIIFLHADTELPEQAFEKVTRLMEDEDVVAGAFRLAFDSDSKWMRLIALFSNIRNRFTKTPGGDQAIFVWREYFERTDGFKPMPIMEDLELMRRIKKRRDGIKILKDKVITSSRGYEKNGIIRKAFKNSLLRLLYRLGVSPYRLAEMHQTNSKRQRGH